MIRIVIADDEALIREGLEIILGAQEDFTVTALAANGEKAARMAEETEADLVLMDIRMPEYDGIYGTKQIKNQFGDTVKVLILTTFQDTEYIRDALKEGASGYLLKDSSYDRIADGIRSAVAGNTVFHPNVVQRMIADQAAPAPVFDEEAHDLTPREIELILLVAEGKTNQEIANTLYLSIGTVKNAISVILHKLTLRDRTQLAIFAYQNGLM